MGTHYRRAGLLAATAMIAAPAGVAFAQTPDGQTYSGVEEIVVTARRREENLQTTPVAITAITAATLEARNVTDLGDVVNIAPNLTLFQTIGGIGSAIVYMRGIGFNDNSVSQDSPVGIYLDGIAAGRVSTAVMQLVEPDSIEVLRGPQGTLFGRNSTAGAILVTTHTPSDDFGGMVKASYGSFQANSVQARIDTGLLGGSGVKLTFGFQHRQQDGFINALRRPGRLDPGAENGEAYFFKAVGDWGPLSAALTADYSKLAGVPGNSQIVDANAATRNFVALSPTYGGGSYAIINTSLRDIPNDAYAGVQHVWNEGLALTLAYALSDTVTLKSITGMRAFKRDDPVSYGPADLRGNVGTVGAPRIASFNGLYDIPLRASGSRQWSEELQLLGSFSDFDYVIGGYYFTEKSWTAQINRFPSGIAATGLTAVETRSLLNYDAASKSRAAFAQVNWRPSALDRKLEVSGGVRHTRDTRTLDQILPVVRKNNLKTRDTSYLGSVSYQWTPGVMTYARYATGYRAGGFNARAAANSQDTALLYQPENIKSWEVGFKLDALDRRVRLNGAAFYNKYKDLQVQRIALPGSVTDVGPSAINADAKYKGFELELTAAPTEGLTLTAAIGYVDPQYTKFPNALQAGAVSPGCFAIRSPSGVLVAQDCYATAAVTVLTKTTASVGAAYAFETAIGQGSARLDYSYRGAVAFGTFYQATTPFKDIVDRKAYGLLSGRLALSDIQVAGGGRGTIALYGENLLNKDYHAQGVDFGFMATKSYAPGRTIGVEGKVEF